MNIVSAFCFFVENILKGEEGIFWSEDSGDGEIRWIFGWGKKIKADFTKGPFPFFSITSFLGEESSFWHFENWVTNEDGVKNGEKSFPQSLQDLRMFSTEKSLEFFASETKDSFCQKVEKIKRLAEEGDVWVLNLAQEFAGEAKDEKILLTAFWRFLQLQKRHAGGVVWTNEQKFCSFSPEIFLIQDGKTLATFPIKGTGTKEYLEDSQKEIAELSMVTDLLRNDLGQIAKRVWMEKERVLVNRGTHHDAQAQIFAELSSSILTWEDYQKLLPAGSISGAPKKRVVENILSLEGFERKWYTGTFGVKFLPESAIFNILIRTLFLEDKKWRFPVGAGITFESDSELEWQEILQKAEILRECLL